ncbi:hypothetical protein K469DRAFT_709403 [Zopfia rhizophila CBS 207.26]|uniref:Uncharacterized protein n=1 Tax=Zopfia rhizophila CBS 207.26 TaxID=1314779 RepID=A0A6A6ESH4_9PEZI|nr:hypothetical protein K469DRAFT_709403 [Zopfia rhizophila CBS 207.26]
MHQDTTPTTLTLRRATALLNHHSKLTCGHLGERLHQLRNIVHFAIHLLHHTTSNRNMLDWLRDILNLVYNLLGSITNCALNFLDRIIDLLDNTSLHSALNKFIHLVRNLADNFIDFLSDIVGRVGKLQGSALHGKIPNDREAINRLLHVFNQIANDRNILSLQWKISHNGYVIDRFLNLLDNFTNDRNIGTADR